MNQPRTSLILTVSKKRIREWGLQDGAHVPVTCGYLKEEAVVHIGENEGDVTKLRWGGNRLAWHSSGLSGTVTYTKKEGIRVGPLIGVMTIGVRHNPQAPIGGRTALLGDFVRGARERRATCFVFNASDINWMNRTVRGVTLVGPPGREVWKFYTFPLPDVVYNRVPHRRAETFPEVRRCKEKCQELGIPLFNERFLNKREMYQWLLADERTCDLIPATGRLRTPENLGQFCDKHALVFLKPIGGSLGQGILRVEREPKQYVVRYKRQHDHASSAFTQSQRLFRFVRQHYPNRTYLMQQGIRLMRYQGNPTDFRVHLHKNGSGQWEAAGIGAKVAGRNSVTTHVHNGGRVLNGNDVLETWYGADAEQMRLRLVEASIRVAEVLEGKLEGPVGEWGLDVGVDDRGRIWIFEANAKPGRAIFRHPDLRSAGRRSAKLLVEYAAHLAGFPLKGGEEA